MGGTASSYIGCSSWKTLMVEKLIKQGKAEIEAKDNEGFTALYHAAWQNHPETLNALARHGANPNVGDSQHLALSRAAHKGHFSVTQTLLEAGAKIQACGLSSCTWTPLAEAAQSGHMDVVQLLLEHGADAQVRDNKGYTPLNWAAIEGYVGIVKLLLDTGGADIETANHFGLTTLSEAASHGYIEVVKLLVQRGADANHCCSLGYSPLHRAAMAGHVAVVKKLISKGGADVNIVNLGGWTPMAETAEHGKPEVVKVLLARGAETDTRNEKGDSPKDQAERRKHWRIVGQIDEMEVRMKTGEVPTVGAGGK